MGRKWVQTCSDINLEATRMWLSVTSSSISKLIVSSLLTELDNSTLELTLVSGSSLDGDRLLVGGA